MSSCWGDGTFRASLEAVVPPCSIFFGGNESMIHTREQGRACDCYQIISERQSPLHILSLGDSIGQLDACLGCDEAGIVII
jgi:hypothetical protein